MHRKQMNTPEPTESPASVFQGETPGTSIRKLPWTPPQVKTLDPDSADERLGAALSRLEMTRARRLKLATETS